MAGPYNSRWQAARRRHLALHPLCVMCADVGRITPASVVDHIEPHRGDTAKFWDSNNWESLCKTCHDAVKQSFEKTGHLRGSDLDGIPLDPRHPWHRGVDE